MGFTEALGYNLKRPFEGRASRSEYWWFFLWTVIVALLILAIFGLMFGGMSLEAQNPEQFSAAFSGGLGIAGLILIFPMYFLLLWMTIAGTCTAVRRLHDRNMSAWWLLLSIIPYIGALILLVIFCLRGTSGPNRFGPDPLQPYDEAVFA